MFYGFNKSTIMYYKAIRMENCKKMYQDNEHLYYEGVKIPLDELEIQYSSNESFASTHICIFPSRNSFAYSSGSSIAKAFKAYSEHDVVFNPSSALLQSIRRK